MKKIDRFIDYCEKSQAQLKAQLKAELKESGYNPISRKGYLYARGDTPILLTAHLDTVHEKKPRNISIKRKNKKTYISADNGIGGDDRCGVYIIMELLRESSARPHILFCEDEEIGGIGSDIFTHRVEKMDVNYMIELDRKGKTDAVFYDCENYDFEDYIASFGLKYDFGSFSDICNLMPQYGIAGVNLSCGYYKAHTADEYVVFEYMERTREKVKQMIESDDIPRFKYIERARIPKYSGGCLYVTYTENGRENYDFIDCLDRDSGLLDFLISHPHVCYNDISECFFEDYNAYAWSLK